MTTKPRRKPKAVTKFLADLGRELAKLPIAEQRRVLQEGATYIELRRALKKKVGKR